MFKFESKVRYSEVDETAHLGNFGYYLNHKPAMSLADTIKEGDVINACIYEGVYPNMESYAYFDKDSAVVSEGGSITLTLMKLGYDENFNAVSSPVANAKLTVENEKLESRHKGLYIIGDGSGITHSLSHASASGVYVARNITEE